MPERCHVTVTGARWGCKPGEHYQCVYKAGHVERGRMVRHAYALPGLALDGTEFIDDEAMSDEEVGLRNG